MENEIAPCYNLVCNFRKKQAFVCILKRLRDYLSLVHLPENGTQNKKRKEKKMLEIIS